MPVTLKNASRTTEVVVLDAQGLDPEKVHTLRIHVDGTTGAQHLERSPKSVPSSLTLLPGETIAGLPCEVLDCTGVRARVARGALRIVSQTPDDAEPTGDKEGKAE